MTRSKVKSRSHHDAAHLQPLTNVPIARTRFSNSRSLQQGQRSNQGQTMMLHTYTPLTIVPTARSKVKSRSDHDTAHLHILTNVPTKYQLPTPYGF